MLRRCGLERLFSKVEWLRDDGYFMSLYEPEPKYADRGLLGAVTDFLTDTQSDGAQAVTRLGITRDEASDLRRAIMLTRFGRAEMVVGPHCTVSDGKMPMLSARARMQRWKGTCSHMYEFLVPR